MSSLLQFTGRYKNGKVGLIFELTMKDENGFTKDCDTFICRKCGKLHSNVYEAFRKPIGMFGCWVVFRYNNQEHVPDLSIPIHIDIDKEKLPKDAKKLSHEQAEKYWHSS